MEIGNLLAFKSDWMTREEQALQVLNEVWEAEGSPTEKTGLLRVLKGTLDRCQSRRIAYPRVFLLRKSQLQRGEFEPSIPGRTVRLTAPTRPKIPQEWLDDATKEFFHSPKK